MILVTGGTGLVGAHLLLQLVQEGVPVRAIFRGQGSLDKARKVFSYYLDEWEPYFKKVQWVEADILDLVALQTAFEKVSMVYHCAALISFDPSDFKILQKVNTEGTSNIVNLCISNAVGKLCYTSSIATVGTPTGENLATEEEYGLGRYPNVYAISKYGAEMEVWRASQEGLPVVILNPGIILGPGNWDNGSGVVFRLGVKDRRFAPPGGSGVVGVLDLVKIMRQLMHADISNERFIVVAENMTYRELLCGIAGEFNRKGPEKIIPIWLLNLLRRVDWIRWLLFGGKRKLTKSSVESLKNPVVYNNSKIKEALHFSFEPVSQTIEFCCHKFREDHPDLFR